ncbi:MAG: thioesterase [Acidimicrobiales bacterium]|nr:thioesterase [Acidimicrobiales bacterium]
MREPGADRLVPVPPSGRVFRGQRRVRFGDVSQRGRLRLDALACYLQDLSSDDTADSGVEDDIPWVVRRCVVEIYKPATFRDDLELATWCSGIGSRWAERRVTATSPSGAHIEAATLWVHVDVSSGRAVPLPSTFASVYGEAACGREISARLQHGVEVPDDAERMQWNVRVADIDMLGHVNNAATWALVEEVLAHRHDLTPPFRAELEYRLPIELGDDVRLAWSANDKGLRIWAMRETRDAALDEVLASARVLAL